MPTWRAPFRSAPIRGRHTVVSARATEVRLENGASLAGWAYLLGEPRPEPRRSRRLAHLGGLVSILALLLYLTWRVAFTMPDGGWNLVAAWTLVVFEAVPLIGLADPDRHAVEHRLARARTPVTEPRPGLRVGGLDPDVQRAGRGDRADHRRRLRPRSRRTRRGCSTTATGPGSPSSCEQYGARYVRRPTHEHAKAGNMNHALDLMAEEEAAGRRVASTSSPSSTATTCRCRRS